jgi:hypothetical protein
MSVLVADPNGSPVAGATVTLSAWPAQYATGAWYDEDPAPDTESFRPYISGTFNNEDTNENTFLDAGEDDNRDGELTPPNSSAGDLPETVTTDENGVANFDLVYLKNSAVWINTRVRASTLVLGTETTSSTTFRMPYILAEGKSGFLPDATYPITIIVSAGSGLTVYYDFPVFRNSTTDTFSTTAVGSSITSPGGVYSYDNTIPGSGSAGDVIFDYVTIIGEVVDPDTGATSYVSVIVPVRIVIE